MSTENAEPNAENRMESLHYRKENGERFVTTYKTLSIHIGNHKQESNSRHPTRIGRRLNPFRREKPYQKRHPFLPLFYHGVGRMSTEMLSRIRANARVKE